MKKDIYVIVGIVALVCAAALAAFWAYNKSTRGSDVAASQADRVDLALLVGDGSPSIGPSLAKVQIVEFLDPECESCRAMHPYLKAILRDYEGRVRYTLRYMPLHGNSVYAASLLEAAREQGKFWEALDVMFEKQSEWASHHAPKPELLPGLLKSIGLNASRLTEAAKKPEFKARIERDRQDGNSAGVTGTPTFFVNGRILLSLGDAPLRNLIEEALRE